MNTITVKLCLGTACYVMGSSHLQELVDIIPARFGDRVAIAGYNCLDLCTSNSEHAGSPYVQIDDEVISNATIEKVLDHIEKKL
jgi:NADH:ubiquinone oxidoreductase subunit E